MSYLSSVLPALPAVDTTQPFPQQPCYFAFGLSPDKKRRETIACASQEDLIKACWSFSQNGWHSYFAQAAYKDSINGRKQENVSSLRALWADIDVGKVRNAYATKHEAGEAIYKFVIETGLQPTYIVDSGVGYYLYWCFTQDLTPGQWKYLSQWLASCMQEKGLVFDPACTCDSARVLRLPFTIHQGCGRQVTVIGPKNKQYYSLQDMVAKLYAIKEPAPLPNKAAPTAAAPAITNGNALFSDWSNSNTPPSADAEVVVQHCPQMQRAGFGTEPSWYAMLCVLRRCVNGREWAHKLSEGDRRYNADDTDRKFDHAPENQPALCTTFELHDPRLCQDCPFKGKIKSPIQITRLVSQTPQVEEPVTAAPAPAVVPAQGSRLVLPAKFEYPLRACISDIFRVDSDGVHYYETVKTKDGGYETLDQIITCSQLYYEKTLWTYNNGKSERQHWFLVINPNGHKERVYIDSATASSAQQLMAWLYASNIYPTDMRFGSKVFVSFMNTYLNSILNNNHMMEIPTGDTFGWREVQTSNGPERGFATGSGVVTADGVQAMEYTGAAARLAEAFEASGTLEEWKHVPNMYKTLDQKAAQLAICLSFAAPLMRWGSGVATSATFSLWSAASGLGKTQLLRACASVWGNPDKQWIQRQASETMRQRQLAVLNNLPAFMDELTDVSDEDLYSLAYSLVGGQEKNKLRRNGVEMANTGSWNTVTFCTANKSIKEAVARCSGDSSASVVRVIEYECDFQSYTDVPQVQAYINACIGKCMENYGIAGPTFVHNVLQHADRLNILTSQIEAWASHNGFTNEERFLSYPLALAIKAGRWAVEWGILDFDMDELEKWVCRTFVSHNRQRTYEHVRKPRTVLLEYLLDRQKNLLYVESEQRTTPVPAPAMAANDSYVRVMPPQSNTIALRLARQEGSLLIAQTDLDRWCKYKNHSPKGLWRALASENIVCQEVMCNLGDGVATLALPVAACYKLDAKAVARLGFNPDLATANKAAVNLVAAGKM